MATAVAIAQHAYVRLARATPSLSITLEDPPGQDPPTPSLASGLITQRAFVVLLIIDSTIADLDDTIDALAKRAAQLQSQQRPVEVRVLVDAATAGAAHDNFARRLPEDLGLPPWPLETYDNAMDLQQCVAALLIDFLGDALSAAGDEGDGGRL